jgi:aminoglycoside 3-N-acetyltransferase
MCPAERTVLTTPARRLKAGVKKRLKMLRHQYARTFRSFTPADLRDALVQLGIVPGDVVFLHSSFDAFAGFTGKATDVIGTLQSVLGAAGTLLMPTLPFTSTAVEYVRNHPVFDVVRTPSRMGLLSELFRRSSDVVRSVHPTHPVAAWGRDAAAMIAGHHRATTPCGNGSPFAALFERNGKILLMGADISSLTFYHMVEEAIETRLPISPFTQERFVLESKQRDGSMVTTDTRLFEPAVSRRRNLYRLMPELKTAGAWRERRVGQLSMTLLNAKDVYGAAIAMVEKGIYCYD